MLVALITCSYCIYYIFYRGKSSSMTTPVINRVADLIYKTTRGPCNSSTNRASCSPAALRWKRANVQTEMQSGTRLSARAECERGRTYRAYYTFRTYPVLSRIDDRVANGSSEPIPSFPFPRKRALFRSGPVFQKLSFRSSVSITDQTTPVFSPQLNQ